MSLHISIISIEGDRVAAAAVIFTDCDYVPVGQAIQVHSEDELNEHLEEDIKDRTKVKKAVYYKDGWTHIVDTELVMMTKESVWCHRSREWAARVLTWICEGASGTYGFALYENGTKRRSVLVMDGEVHEDFGAPLPEEEGIAWSEAFEDEVLQVTERLGAPSEYCEGAVSYDVYLLDESHIRLPSKN
jgi:hypothetical protein